MKREIKFRAWVYERMTLPFTLQEVFKDGEFLDWNIDKAIIMQFTGLKDAKGVDIYEGDILRFPPKDKWENENYNCFEVFFHDGDANTDYNIGYSINRLHPQGNSAGGYIPSFKPKTVSKMITIGNIYENPKLL